MKVEEAVECGNSPDGLKKRGQDVSALFGLTMNARTMPVFFKNTEIAVNSYFVSELY